MLLISTVEHFPSFSNEKFSTSFNEEIASMSPCCIENEIIFKASLLSSASISIRTSDLSFKETLQFIILFSLIKSMLPFFLITNLLSFLIALSYLLNSSIVTKLGEILSS